MRMIIANRLLDGRVVFLTKSGEWAAAIADGLVIRNEADEARWFDMAKSAETECLVVDPNLIDVTVEDGVPKPVAIRESIRAFGPTV